MRMYPRIDIERIIMKNLDLIFTAVFACVSVDFPEPDRPYTDAT